MAQTISHPSYRAPFLLSDGHIQTLFPVLFRRVSGLTFDRERIATPDEDFIDIDWVKRGSTKAVVLVHGLEGNSKREYILGMSRAMLRRGWDCAAMNFRGCSGEPNRTMFFYHHGKTDDLHTVVSHVVSSKRYESVALIGFSLGGNVTLKYLGDGVYTSPVPVRCAVAISVPCDLAACAQKLTLPSNGIYMRRFLRLLHEKIKAKVAQFPGCINDDGYECMRTFEEFDDRYTAPIHGFSGAHEYWEKCSSKQFLSKITVPTLIINARNDPFLTDSCRDLPEARENTRVTIDTPDSGGHVGFLTFGHAGEYWHEMRTASFIEEQLSENGRKG